MTIFDFRERSLAMLCRLSSNIPLWTALTITQASRCLYLQPHTEGPRALLSNLTCHLTGCTIFQASATMGKAWPNYPVPSLQPLPCKCPNSKSSRLLDGLARLGEYSVAFCGMALLNTARLRRPELRCQVGQNRIKCRTVVSETA